MENKCPKDCAGKVEKKLCFPCERRGENRMIVDNYRKVDTTTPLDKTMYAQTLAAVEKFMIKSGIRKNCSKICKGKCCGGACHDRMHCGDKGVARVFQCSTFLCNEVTSVFSGLRAFEILRILGDRGREVGFDYYKHDQEAGKRMFKCDLALLVELNKKETVDPVKKIIPLLTAEKFCMKDLGGLIYYRDQYIPKYDKMYQKFKHLLPPPKVKEE